MPNSNIYTHDIFIKRLEYHLKKLSETLQQIDILLYSAGQSCRELSRICKDECD